MEHLLGEQRVVVIKTFYQNDSSVVNTRRKLRDYFGHHRVPSKSTILRTVKNFETQYTVLDRPKSGRSRSARSTENIEAVRAHVENNPSLSVRNRAQQLGLNRHAVWSIMKNDIPKKDKEPKKIADTNNLNCLSSRFVDVSSEETTEQKPEATSAEQIPSSSTNS